MNRLRQGSALLCLLASLGCEPKLVVGDFTCSPSAGGSSNAGGSSAAGGATSKSDARKPNEGPLPAPWQTSFDDGFCSYESFAGFCYGDADSSYRLVTSPVHTGPFAAAFDIHAGVSPGERQTRCVREGVLPDEAYYGAWYYVPSGLPAAHDWNLFHFRAVDPGRPQHGLWDVSMDDSAGPLTAYVYGHLELGHHYAEATPKEIPLDRWFQLEFYFKRAADATGEIALYQDGEEVIRATALITDDSSLGRWYVGNYTTTAASTLPPTSSVYVDDVTVRLP